jgi:hypothetical protein
MRAGLCFFVSVALSIAAGSCCNPLHVMFDDMNYRTVRELESNGWTVRTKPGWPGIPGAGWSKENVSFLSDPEKSGNCILRMTSSAGITISQTQICHKRKYLEGTYAARVRFSRSAGSMPDMLVQSFYAITPYAKPLDPAYSEMDFEYLPFGGYRVAPGTLATTTWDTVSIDPWKGLNATNSTTRNLAGWHVLVIQVGGGKVNYFIDGESLASHAKPYYPDSYMSINFNLWFLNVDKSGQEARRYIEEVDWVFFAANQVLDTPAIEDNVNCFKGEHIGFMDTVPDTNPPLDCPCDL